MANDPKERVIRYLDDCHALEGASIAALKDMISEATDGDEKRMYEEHLRKTEGHKARLEQRLKDMDSSPSGMKEAMNRFGIALTDLLHAAKDSEDKAARNLIQAYTMECCERACYEALMAAASAAGDSQTEAVAREIQNDEKDAAKTIFSRIKERSRIAVMQG